MKCHDAEKWILLDDSGEMPAKNECALIAHLNDCDACRQFKHALTKSELVFHPVDEPSAQIMQHVLREARQNAPQKKRATIWLIKPAIAAAAAAVVGLGLFFATPPSDQVGLELMVTETQLLTPDDQIASVMYNGLSEDDLAFNFLMTYEDSYATL